MSEITERQYEELCEAKGFDREEFHKLLSEHCGIEARPYTGYSYYDNLGNYIGDSNDCDVKTLLDNAYIKIAKSEQIKLGRWEPMRAIPSQFICSECGDLWPDFKAGECPNCHAIMDIEDKEIQ